MITVHPVERPLVCGRFPVRWRVRNLNVELYSRATSYVLLANYSTYLAELQLKESVRTVESHDNQILRRIHVL